MALNTKLDAAQVLKQVYDESAQALKTTGSASVTQTVVQPDGSQLHVTVDESALPTGAATEASLSDLALKTSSGLVTEAHDALEIAYVGSTTDIDTVTYKNSGATVATLTMAYDGQGRLTGVTKS